MAAQTVGEELAVEVPEREPVSGGVQLLMRRAPRLEWIEVGDEVAAHAEGADELQDLRLLGAHLIGRCAAAQKRRRGVGGPAHRAVRHVAFVEDAVVEAVLAAQQLLDPR